MGYKLEYSEIDHKKLDFYQEYGYCPICKFYHNERIYIKIRKIKFYLDYDIKCESCLKIYLDGINKIGEDYKLNISNTEIKFNGFIFFNNRKIDLLLKNEFDYLLLFSDIIK